MTLDEYLDSLTPSERRGFIEASGLHPKHLSQIRRRWRAAGVKTATAIEMASDGKVTLRDLRPDLFGGELLLRVKGQPDVARSSSRASV